MLNKVKLFQIHVDAMCLKHFLYKKKFRRKWGSKRPKKITRLTFQSLLLLCAKNSKFMPVIVRKISALVLRMKMNLSQKSGFLISKLYLIV